MTSHRIGLLGSHIGTSLSPTLHEAEASALGLAGYRYELLDLETLGRAPEEAAAVLREALQQGFTGFNVTHPCKQTVIAGLDALHPDAEALGAVNTVAVKPDGRLVGHNTDHSGFLAAFRMGLPDVDLAEVVLTGAGGAGAAVAHALADAGVERLVVADVMAERASELAEQMARQHPGTRAEVVAADRAAARVATASGVVNASPVGMEGFPGLPFDVLVLRPEHWVADIVYRPVRTALLAAAAQRGCRILDGAQMLVAQAADTFALLTRTAPDRDRMRRHLHDVLAARPVLAS